MTRLNDAIFEGGVLTQQGAYALLYVVAYAHWRLSYPCRGWTTTF